jgi:hypothetical protein
MPVFLSIVIGYFAMFVGVMMRFIKDDKDGLRDGFDDSEEVSK